MSQKELSIMRGQASILNIELNPYVAQSWIYALLNHIQEMNEGKNDA